MYFGLRAHHDSRSAHDYESARAVLANASKTPTGRQRKEKPFGYHLGMSSNHGVTWVRECDEPGYEGAIAFRLYDTDVVTWYPDNSVEIDNFGSVTTSAFARQFLPGCIGLSHPSTRRGETGGHKGITYCVEAADYDRRYWGTYRICFGGLPRFRLHGERWLPDEDTLDEIKFPEITDRKAQRAVSAKYHLKDFDNWLAMAPRHMRIEHDCWDVDDCAKALLKRDFTTASMFLPLTTESGAYSMELKIIPIVTRQRDQHVTVGAISKLKLALWDLEGLVETVSFKTLPCGEFERRMQRVKLMRRLGLCGYGVGPPRW